MTVPNRSTSLWQTSKAKAKPVALKNRRRALQALKKKLAVD